MHDAARDALGVRAWRTLRARRRSRL